MTPEVTQAESPEGNHLYSHPGYLRSYNWFLEIYRKSRANGEHLTLAINTFTLPERVTETFQIAWGPGRPVMTFPGKVEPFQFHIDVTNFYTHDIVEFLISWQEHARIDFPNNVHDGAVIGRDSRNIIRYKAHVYHLFPIVVSLGSMNRVVDRQQVSATLACYDIVHDFTFEKFEFEEG